MRKIWKAYKNDLPLRTKFLLITLLIVFSTAVTAYFVIMYAYSIIRENTISSESALVTQTSISVSSATDNIETVMNSLASSPFLARMTYTDNLDDYFSDSRTASYAKDFFSTVNTLLESNNVTAIRVYVHPEYDKACSQYSFSDVLQPLSNVKGSYWHGIFMGAPEIESLYCPSFYLTGREKKDLGSLAYIRRYDGGSLQETDDREATFWLVVYFSLPDLEALLQQNMHGTENVYYLINSRSNLVASSDSAMSGLYYLDYNAIPEAIKSDRMFARTSVLGLDLYMAYREVEGTDWRLVSVIPVDSVTSRQQELYQRLAFIYVLVSLAALLLQLLLSNSIAGRITRITRHMTKRGRSSQEKIRSFGEKDEIGQLVAAYNDTMDQLSELLASEAQSAERLRVAEVRALQAQINPHFLYNMFDMINWLSMSGNQQAVSEAVRYLSQFYKLTLSGQSIYVTLAEELHQVELYVHLQNMRFDQGIQFLVDVSDEYLDCRIPRLILQPIVENSILHGICEREDRQGDIVIMAWHELTESGEDLVITVSDTGVGIEPEQLEKLLTEHDHPSAKQSSGTNIAISNTHQRLKLIYGERAGLSFSSVYGEGTEVQVRIPLEKAVS